MDYNLVFDNSNDIFIAKTSGKMSSKGFVDMAQSLLRHPRWVADKDVIFDHTSLYFSDVPLADLEVIRGFHKENEHRIGSGKSAIVVSPGFSGKWHKLWSRGQKIQSGNKVMVFEDFNDAVQWVKKHKGVL